MTSSPGLPYCREATTNRDWLEWNGVSCSNFKLDRLWHDVQSVLAGRWEHLIRVFVKQEPHKKAKVVEKRWRLIMASSLSVQLVWHMLFSYQNDLEIKNAYHIPSQQGVVLVNGGWKRYRQQWLAKGLTCGLDKSAWDWTCASWLLDADLEFRFRSGSGRRMIEWRQLAREMYDRMFVDPVLVLSNGTMWRQVVPGVMKSGCVNTISTNSHCQVFVHFLTCFEQGISPFPVCVACGDDTLQAAEHCADISVYHKFGVKVKSASDDMEFVGHEITSHGPHPLYMAKHVKKLRYVSEEILPQYFDAMARMYVHTRYF
nr:MAG: RNA-dependent RNA polymerase [Riboviria sp.]